MPDISHARGRDADLALIYIADSLKEAETVQDTLEGERIECFTSLEEYRLDGPVAHLFQGGNYSGIGFYVPNADVARSTSLLRERRLVRGLVNATVRGETAG